MIFLAGILGKGTEATSEVVSNPGYPDAMLQKAPKNWDQLNLEAIIEANVIAGHLGPPTVVAVETWQDVSIPKKLYHLPLETAPRFSPITLKILHLYMPLHRLIHDAAYKSNQLSLI